MAKALADTVHAAAYSMNGSTLEERIRQYWSQRADGFAEVRRQELSGNKPELWLKEIVPWLPSSKKQLHVLDVGTGAGFFAILLARHGCAVTAIDNCSAMLEEARKLAEDVCVDIRFLQMSACELEFPDGSFDCIVSRNVTWNLPDPLAAYQEWGRVLRAGGSLINFDADYGSVNFTALGKGKEPHAHADIKPDMLRECEMLRQKLPLSDYLRPECDMNILKKLGFSNIFCDRKISDRIFRNRDASYNPVPMFSVVGIKD